MKKNLILLLAILAVAGCTRTDRAWLDAPMHYTCTMEQAKQVNYETDTCMSANKEWSGYTGAYCYGSAIVRNCSEMAPVKP